MLKRFSSLLALVLLSTAGCIPSTEDSEAGRPNASTPSANPIVGGAAMYPNRNVIQNAVNSKDHTTLVQIVRAAGLAGTLSDTGPYTVFAPTNAAFDKLPTGTVQTLLDPANKSLLAKILNYHVVPGRKTRAQIATDIRAGGGTASYTSVAGGPLRARMEGSALILSDAKGGRSRVTQADVIQSNGVVHVVDTVLLPAI